MPELPDIIAYNEALAARIMGQRLEKVRIVNPFVLRSADPPIKDAEGRAVTGIRRLGKRIVIALEGDYFFVIHLMIAGRLQWNSKRKGLAVLEFASGNLTFTEAGTQHRASLHLVRGEEALRAHDRGGLEVLDASLAAFTAAVRSERHTLKRTLTDPTIMSGIGNAYSDEILHAAKLSPLQLSTNLDDDEIERLYHATQRTLRVWIDRMRGEDFPEKVTAFRPEMAVHGKYGQPCPVCGAPVQRIRYAANESNYCVKCQTGGRLLADRAMSRLLKDDWPRTLEEWEEKKKSG